VLGCKFYFAEIVSLEEIARVLKPFMQIEVIMKKVHTSTFLCIICTFLSSFNATLFENIKIATQILAVNLKIFQNSLQRTLCVFCHFKSLG